MTLAAWLMWYMYYFCNLLCFISYVSIILLLLLLLYYIYFFLWRCDPTRVMASSFLRFLDHTRRTTVGRTPLDEWSARRRNFYLTTHNTHTRKKIHAPGGIWTHDLSRRAAADLRLRPHGHWDRHYIIPFHIILYHIS